MGAGSETGCRVRLWWASCRAAEAFAPRLEALLDEGERHRLERIRVPAARRQFAAARALTRLTLAQATGIGPSLLRLEYGPRGKPTLDHGGSPSAPRFNLAHSGDTVALAVAAAEVGVDVEAVRSLPGRDRLLRRFCSDPERRWVRSRPEEERDRSFLKLWTCKEAYLKAVGAGIAMALRDVEVDGAQGRLLRIAGDEAPATEWTLLSTVLPEPALATVAIRGRGWRLEVRQFQWEADAVPLLDHWESE
jgi:4'-phosphopantetheinyl transferase